MVKFKAGDRVRMVRDGASTVECQVGHVVVVENASPFPFVKWPSGEYAGCADQDDFELAGPVH